MGTVVGVKEVIVGAEAMYVNVSLDVAAPLAEITETVPKSPPLTTAVILVALTTVNDPAGDPPNVTDVAPVKFVPVIVTVVPVAPLVGVKDVIICAWIFIT